MEAQQRIAELEQQVSNLLRIKRELEDTVYELTPRTIFTAILRSDGILYWVEAQIPGR